MDTGSGRAIEIALFHSGGQLKGFLVSGRWPDSTKEWAQLLIVTVRIASLPGLLSTTTIFGVREDLPEAPQPGTVGIVIPFVLGAFVAGPLVLPGMEFNAYLFLGATLAATSASVRGSRNSETPAMPAGAPSMRASTIARPASGLLQNHLSPCSR